MNRKKNSAWPWLAGAGIGLTLGMRIFRRLWGREDFDGQVVLISGGSRGLGLLLAREFGRQGARLALFARDLGELEAARSDLRARNFDVLAVPCDIRRQDQVRQAVGQVLQVYGRVDVLVNCAGVIQVGPAENMTLEDYQDAMDTHFWGSLYTTLAVIEPMRQRGGGRIVNITSIGGEVAVPHLLPYTASKFAQVGLSDGLRTELARDGISVTTVIPGLMRTGSYVNAGFKGQHEKEYAWFSIAAANPLTATSGERAARQIVEACRYRQAVLVITWQARLIMLLDALFPGLTAQIMKAANRWILPPPPVEGGEVLRRGYESRSDFSPSPLTFKGDRTVEETNQIR